MPKIIFFLFLFFCGAAQALSPEAKLANDADEQRARNLFLQVRCLVCAGQVIENSDTEFSFEMRKLIRREIAAGKTDQEIKTELVQKFGEDILTEPSVNGLSGFLLWGLPLMFAAIIGAVFVKLYRR
jgi:cytochrome c-type biogenesis protein CcmH